MVVPIGVINQAFLLASEQISRMWGVHKDLQTIGRRLELIQGLLSDAEGKSTSSIAVELWLKNLEAISVDADNLLDEFAYQILRDKIESRKQDKVRSFFSSSNPLAIRFKMVSQIKKLNLTLEKMYQESNVFGFRPVEILNTSFDLGRDLMTDPFVEETEIVGRDDDIRKIVNLLTCSEDQNEIGTIGIVGMAGVGKTAVAQLVVKNENVVKHFEKRVWLCVSNDFNVERILKEMLQSLTQTVSDLTIREVIVRRLKMELNGKRFLLVLDDVWNENTSMWECVRKCLKEIGGLKGSSIIVTTRSERVVSIMQESLIYHLGVLSQEDSWAMFEKIAFAKGGAVKAPELVNIGEKMVNWCLGVPLAIKAIGGLMYSNKDGRSWSAFEEGGIRGSSDALEGIMSIFKITYDHLPSFSLKQCFRYCSVFPKSFVLERKQLVQIWMAQGFLNPSRQSKLEMEDIGNNNFNILLQRSLLQNSETDKYGNIESCKMHDLVHDFALEEGKGSYLMVEGRLVNDDTNVLHLSINVNKGERINTSTEVFKRLRTLILSGGILSDVLVHCKFLRVLVVVDKNVKVLPNSVGRLKHLRYLDISRTSITVLPSNITKLYNLQTLRLYYLKKLPKNFRKMVNLRHFTTEREEIGNVENENLLTEMGQIPNGNKCLLRWIGNLTSLRTIPHFVVTPERGCQIEELGFLQNLEGVLKVFGLHELRNYEEAKKANLSRKKKIESLELYWDISRREYWRDDDVLEGLKPHTNLKGLKIVNFLGKNLPSWMLNTSYPPLLHNLVHIKFQNLVLCEQIPPLGQLPHLKVLEIVGMYCLKYISNEFYGWTNLDGASCSQSAPTNSSIVVFPSLKHLVLDYLPHLEEWSDMVRPSHSSVEIFPQLEILEVKLCEKLTHLPDILDSIVSLKQLSVLCCENLAGLPKELGSKSLESLIVFNCPNVVYIPSIQGLQSLRVLVITGCMKLVTLPSGFQECSTLDRLVLSSSSDFGLEDLRVPINIRDLWLALHEDHEYFPWPRYTVSGIQQSPFASLEALTLSGTPSIKSLPDQIQYLPLRKLWLQSFQGLEALPEWLGNIYSLVFLVLWNCKNLMHFPSLEAMKRLTNLKELEIEDCPIVSKICGQRSGPEWLKISHLPRIYLKPDTQPRT